MYRQYTTYIKTKCNNYNYVTFGYIFQPLTAIFRPTKNNINPLAPELFFFNFSTPCI